VPRSDTGGGGGVRGEDGLSLGMTSGSHKSASAGAGEGRLRLRRWRAGWAERPSGLARTAGAVACTAAGAGWAAGWHKRAAAQACCWVGLVGRVGRGLEIGFRFRILGV
jgi:hypothetical protein